jgi:hypothetical protein
MCSCSCLKKRNVFASIFFWKYYILCCQEIHKGALRRHVSDSSLVRLCADRIGRIYCLCAYRLIVCLHPNGVCETIFDGATPLRLTGFCASNDGKWVYVTKRHDVFRVNCRTKSVEAITESVKDWDVGLHNGHVSTARFYYPVDIVQVNDRLMRRC